MGYEELKKLVVKKLKFNPNYLDEQIDILDDKIALLKTINVVESQFKTDERVLNMLIKIKEDLETEEICECGHKQWEEHKSSFYNYKGLKMVAQECNVKGCKCKKFVKREIKK